MSTVIVQFSLANSVGFVKVTNDGAMFVSLDSFDGEYTKYSSCSEEIQAAASAACEKEGV